MGTGFLTATNIIVGVTCAISLLLMNNRTGISALVLHPVSIKQKHQWHRFLTSGFIHADFLHLFINMFVLWSFGNAIENYYYPYAFGEDALTKYLILYYGGIVVASAPDYWRNRDNRSYAALGASGGVSAVVFAAILFEPWQNLYLYGVVPLPQILAGLAYLYYSWTKDKKSNDNIAHMAHLAGAIWGFVFTGLMNSQLFMQFVLRTLEGPHWI